MVNQQTQAIINKVLFAIPESGSTGDKWLDFWITSAENALRRARERFEEIRPMLKNVGPEAFADAFNLYIPAFAKEAQTFFMSAVEELDQRKEYARNRCRELVIPPKESTPERIALCVHTLETLLDSLSSGSILARIQQELADVNTATRLHHDPLTQYVLRAGDLWISKYLESKK